MTVLSSSMDQLICGFIIDGMKSHLGFMELGIVGKTSITGRRQALEGYVSFHALSVFSLPSIDSQVINFPPLPHCPLWYPASPCICPESEEPCKHMPEYHEPEGVCL